MRILPSKKQSGVVLVISLVMLLLLTLIGLTGMQTTTLEEKMAGNAKDRNLAFQAAESTLLEAEKFILANSTTSSTYSGSAGLLDTGDSEPDFLNSATWAATNSASTTTGFGNNFGLPADPRYIIKKISQVGNKSTFRITARAVGRQAGSQVILQEIYQRTN